MFAICSPLFLCLSRTARSLKHFAPRVHDRLHVDVAAFLPELLRFIEQDPEPGDDLDAWRRLLVPHLGEAATAIHYAPYRRDVPDRDAPDALGIMSDVEAFARLICLKEAKPPLSIGLFGDWGSGKSFFMEKLAKSIDELAATAKSIPAQPFVDRVAQIKFNAWHYADANLWASLTAEFFDQLRAGGHSARRGLRFAAVVDEVTRRVAEARADVAGSDARGKQLEEELAQASAALADAEASLRSLPITVLTSQVASSLEAFRQNNRENLDRTGRAVGRESLSDDLTALQEEARVAGTSFGRLAVFARSLSNMSLRNVVFYLGAFVLVISFAALPSVDPDRLGPFLAAGSSALAGLGVVLVALARGWSVVRPLLRPLADMPRIWPRVRRYCLLSGKPPRTS